MFDRIREAKDQFKMLKELQSKLGDVDMSNPSEFLKSMGVNLDDLNSHFENLHEEHEVF